ncbi:MAG: nucleotidyltransferase domain-containing protein [Flavobacteriales bacterium]|nr:nucleotidyltransferase domain-containing protein [Flavobacteriales bacterium]
MLTKTLLSEYSQELNDLCKAHEVSLLYVFGSYATGNQNTESDIDFLVAFKDIPLDRYTDHYFELHEKLEQLFGRPIDLLTVNSLSNPYFIQSVEETKQLLYAA